jgi:hypothetical protein
LEGINMKKPWLAALLNIILPGLGYVYAGQRMTFGLGMLLTSIFLYWGYSLEDLPAVVWIDGIIMSILFAYDAYKDVSASNTKKK